MAWHGQGTHREAQRDAVVLEVSVIYEDEPWLHDCDGKGEHERGALEVPSPALAAGHGHAGHGPCSCH